MHYLALAQPAPRGNIVQALKTDLFAMDEQHMLDLVSSLKLEGSTQPQRIEFFARLKARFDAMPLTQKLALMLDSRKAVLDAPNGPLVDNGRLLMEAYWNRETQVLHPGPTAQRQKMLDARIDESLVYENLENLQNAAKGLFGGKSGPSDEDLRQMRSQVVARRRGCDGKWQTRRPGRRRPVFQ